MAVTPANELQSLLDSLALEGAATRLALLQLRARILPLAADPAHLDTLLYRVLASHERVSRVITNAQQQIQGSDAAGRDKLWAEWSQAREGARSYFAELRGNIEEMERAAGEKEAGSQLQTPMGQQ